MSFYDLFEKIRCHPYTWRGELTHKSMKGVLAHTWVGVLAHKSMKGVLAHTMNGVLAHEVGRIRITHKN